VLVLKRGLLWVPFFAGARHAVAKHGEARRTGADLRRLLEQGKDRLAQGFWIVVFPEGTRVRPGERAKFQGGRRMARVPHQGARHPRRPQRGRAMAKNGFPEISGDSSRVSIEHPSILRTQAEELTGLSKLGRARKARIGSDCNRSESGSILKPHATDRSSVSDA